MAELDARPPVPQTPMVQPVPAAPTVEESESDLTLLKPPPKSSKEYLKRRLRGRVEVPSAALFKDAAKYGFSPKMLRTAKNALKVMVFANRSPTLPGVVRVVLAWSEFCDSRNAYDCEVGRRGLGGQVFGLMKKQKL
jgi:hypothetical protein